VARYITFRVSKDPEELIALAFDYMRSNISGWEPAEGNLDVWMLEAFGSLSAEVAEIASLVPAAIFRYYGNTLMGLPPADATAASITSTWVAKDNAGYVVEAGTLVGITNLTGDTVPFEVMADVTIPSGQTTTEVGAVTLVALLPGEDASGIGGNGQIATLLDVVDWVTSVTLTGVTTGGQDAETDDEYLDRLATLLRLMAPRPILPQDFAILARQNENVYRALAVDGLNPAVNEVQSVTLSGATGGTFTLTFSGQTTGNIAFDASAAVVQTALEVLSNINVGDVLVSAGPVQPNGVQVTFRGQYAGSNVGQLTADTALLTGTPNMVITTVTQGAAAQTGQERMVAIALVDENGEAVSNVIKQEVDADLEAKREVNFIVNIMDPNYNYFDVTTTVKAWGGVETADLDTRVTAAITDYLSPKNWGRRGTGERDDPRDWYQQVMVRYLEIAQAINDVDGVDYISSLTFGIQGGALGTTDVTMVGDAPLPRPGTINVTVT
jgi:hypothetical protein